jgi:hypothetical protein
MHWRVGSKIIKHVALLDLILLLSMYIQDWRIIDILEESLWYLLSGNFCTNRTVQIVDIFKWLRIFKICCLYYHWRKPETIWRKKNLAACKRIICANLSQKRAIFKKFEIMSLVFFKVFLLSSKIILLTLF